MVRLLGFGAAAVLAVTMLSACGGSDDPAVPTAVTAPAVQVPAQPTGTLDKAALAKAADINCGYQNDRLARLGPLGITPAGISASAAGDVPVMSDVQALQAAFDAAPPVAETWDEYLKASQAAIEAREKVSEVSDETELEAANTTVSAAASKTYPPADALGLEVCTYTPPPTVEETEMNDPASFDLAEPTNTPDQAAKQFLAAVDTGECSSIKAVINSDYGIVPDNTCNYLLDTYSGLGVIGSQSYGPVAMVTFGDEEDASRQGTVEFVIDQDGALKFTNEAFIPGGSIHPPSEGFDAQETIDTAVAAIRDEDSAAFADVVGPDGAYTDSDDPLAEFASKPSGETVVEAIRSNPDVDAVMIAANQGNAYFIFDTEDQDFLFTLGHSPGSETEYRNMGYWGLPDAEA